MLKLVSHPKKHSELDSAHEMERNPSREYIDEVIAQIKYVHLEEVWQAGLDKLTEPLALAASSKRKHLKIL